MTTQQVVRRSLENFDNIMGKVALCPGCLISSEAATVIMQIQDERMEHTRYHSKETVSQKLESLLCRLLPMLPPYVRQEVQKTTSEGTVH